MYNENVWGGLVAVLGSFLFFIIIIALAAIVVQIIANVKLYKKAGKDGWEAIIPFYSTWVRCEIAGVKWWFFLIINAEIIVSIIGLAGLIPLAGLASLAASFACNYNIAKKFGKDPIGFGIGLTLLPVVFDSILGFGDANYSDVSVSSYGPIEEEKVSNVKANKNSNASETKKANTKSKAKFCKNCGAELDDGKFCSNCGTENTQK